MRTALVCLTLTTDALCPVALRAQNPVELSSLGYARGEPSAPVVVVEFGDFGCSACAQFANETFADFQRRFVETGVVAWRFVPFVLGSFRNSREAATAAECVADLEPESFWSMHDLLFERQGDWNGRRRPKEQLSGLAAQLGVNEEAFEECYDEGSTRERIDRNSDAARQLGVRATPTFFVNGQPVMGALSLNEWSALVESIQGRTTGN